MKAELYWIDDAPGLGRLGIMPRPRGGDWLEEDIQSLREQGVNVLVSMLTTEETGRFRLEHEEEEAKRTGIEFVSLPVGDMSVPDDDLTLMKLVNRICGWVSDGKGVAVHCFGGIGRSGMLLACVLVKLGKSSDEAIKMISKARGFTVPQTGEQSEWIERMEWEMNR